MSTTHSSRNAVQEEEEDLGLGNTSHTRNKPAGTSEGAAVANAAEEAAEKEETKKEEETPSDRPLHPFSFWYLI